MSKLQTPQHQAIRSFLRIAGPLTGCAGFMFLIVGMVSFFSAFGGFKPPENFWCCFVGMPLLALGIAMSKFGYFGAVARYLAAEQVPVATDTISDLAEGTQDSVKKMTKAAAEGLREGWDSRD